MRIVILIILLVYSQAMPSQDLCWPNYRGNENLTGQCSSVISDKYHLKWTYETGDIIKSSPVVGKNKILVGNNSGKLICLDTDGNR